jgi:hypothetical protein
MEKWLESPLMRKMNFFRRIRGQYKLMRIARYLSLQMDEIFEAWKSQDSTPETASRARELLNAGGNNS